MKYDPEFIGYVKDLARQLKNGCGNSGCVIKQPVGMHTNGPCRCRPRDIHKDLKDFQEYLEKNYDLITNQPR